MAEIARRLPQNVTGDFFVDSSCIDCDTCRQIAPGVFRDHGGQMSVYRQPENDEEIRRALMALVCCPTGSIGTVAKRDVREAVRAFPAIIDQNVFFCGFTSEASFGAWSYLIVRSARDGGNVLVDSPRFTAPLVRRIEEAGGLRTIFLTHRDDVADHDRFARRFGAERIMHAADGASRIGAERVIQGFDSTRLDEDLLAIPTPGHTRGHMVLLYKEKYLFTGDHLAWSPELESLTAFRDVAWYSWPEQVRSMRRLLSHSFEWVLPGHGWIHNDTRESMRAHLIACLGRMASGAEAI